MAGLTSQEMKYEAQIAYEALASADAPGYTDKQWSILLTQAQENLVLSLCRSGMDAEELGRRAISKLIVERSETPDGQHQFIENGWVVSLQDNYLHILKDTAHSNKETQIKVKPVSYDFYHANTENPFYNPTSKEFWRLVGKESVIIVTDGSTLTDYDIIYVKRPVPIIVGEGKATEPIEIEGYTGPKNCELDHSVHRIIVSEAANLALTYTRNVNQ